MLQAAQKAYHKAIDPGKQTFMVLKGLLSNPPETVRSVLAYHRVSRQKGLDGHGDT